MADGARYSRALILGASVVSIAAMMTESGLAQTASPRAENASSERPKQAGRKPPERGGGEHRRKIDHVHRRRAPTRRDPQAHKGGYGNEGDGAGINLNGFAHGAAG